ncbi:hypothetical protein [Stieleria marina]|uniref:Uncharacterized protein n=1 Tax=Stieleria marina TaxID=1930275 RepID=A0A517NY40_9BACT|nr:hypothetical protein K239x_40490 [Planctomycetes bacterium K23_9]
MGIRAGCLVVLLVLCCQCMGQGVKPLTFDGVVGDPSSLQGLPMTLQFLSGVTVKDSELVSFVRDRKSDSIQFVQYQDGNRKPKKRADEIYRLVISGVPYRLRFHGPSNGFFLIDELVSINKSKSRLEERNASFRSIATAAETQEDVLKQKAFYSEAMETLANPHLRTYESKFSLLLTDFPAPIAARVGQYVDDLCVRLNQLNGVPVSANIWQGKVMIALFSDQLLMATYETDAMNNPNFGKASIIYHNTGDKFMVVCHGKQMNIELARKICWGVAGGYVVKYGSDLAMPEWLKVGTREWVTAKMFPNRNIQKSRVASSTRTLQQSRSLLGILSAKEFNNDRNGTAQFLVTHLLNQNTNAFGQFFQDVKAGHDWEDSLITNYGVTANQFAAAFGRSLGVANVVP